MVGRRPESPDEGGFFNVDLVFYELLRGFRS